MPAIITGLVALAAALPAGAAADAQPRVEVITPAGSAQVNVSALTPQAVQQLLAQLPVGDSGAGAGAPAVSLELGALAKVIAELPGIDALPGVGGLGGQAGLEAALHEALGKLLAGGSLPLGELLSSPMLSGELLKALEAATHLPVAELIEGVLHGSPQAIIGQGLDSIDLSELLAKLVGASPNPSQLLEQLLAGLNPATLEALLGTLPSGDPVQSLDLGELASQLSKTPQQLAEALGQTLTTLPETAKAATQALSDGDELALVKGLEGLNLGLVERTTEGAGILGSSSDTSTGADGGNGGTPAATTVVVALPAGTAPGSTPTSAKAAALAPVKIISHKVNGSKVTFVVQVPSAGKLTLSGNGFKKVAKETSKAERMTVQTTLTKARAASLRKHHRKTSVKLTSTFLPVSGHSSSASASVSVR
ncbi:MAG TPA: hypothetical protein VK761_00235 [Solirubrobacteraceae bacterium]|nr:hypothetical protein [Solirubrobacteraceae bacterium]